MSGRLVLVEILFMVTTPIAFIRAFFHTVTI